MCYNEAVSRDIRVSANSPDNYLMECQRATMDYITIPLSKRGKNKDKYEAIISPEDAELANLNWSYGGEIIYPTRKIGKRNVRLHQMVMERMRNGEPLKNGEVVDHINRNPLDNRRENLRLATRSQNSVHRNKQPYNKTGYKGVSIKKSTGKFLAVITVNKKQIHLGYFDTAEKAYQAYCQAAIEYHGEFFLPD